jgi:TRAP-type C4-dicarboxylate transport system permease small subunit
VSFSNKTRLVEQALDASAIVLFAGMCGLVLAQVVMRKFFEPLVWSEELARYVFIWVSFLGWTIACRKRSHVAVMFAADRAPPLVRTLLGCLSEVGTIVLACILMWYGSQLVRNNTDVETVTLFFNYALVYAIVPFSGLMMVLISIASLHRRLQGHNEAVEVLL